MGLTKACMVMGMEVGEWFGVGVGDSGGWDICGGCAVEGWRGSGRGGGGGGGAECQQEVSEKEG